MIYERHETCPNCEMLLTQREYELQYHRACGWAIERSFNEDDDEGNPWELANVSETRS